MSFSTINLVNDRVLVRGTDSTGSTGEEVLNAQQWREIKRLSAHKEAEEKFNATVEEFFKPLTDAADELDSSLQPDADDRVTYVVLEEATEGAQAQPEKRLHLNRDSVILRLIEQGNTDRLVWINEQLEVMTQVTPAQAQANVEEILDATAVNEAGEDLGRTEG